MIRAADRGRGLALEADLPEGTIAFVDADSVAPGGDVPALLVGEGVLRSSDGYSADVPRELTAEEAAARALLAVARDAAATAGRAGGTIEVPGRGLIATAVRALLARTAVDPDGPAPETIVETSGEPEAIVAATKRLADLGTLVLAGQSVDPLAIDLYPDVHVRCLELVGVAWPEGALPAPHERLGALAAGTLRDASPGAPLPDGLWYRLRS